jgi:hypothetical protein
MSLTRSHCPTVPPYGVIPSCSSHRTCLDTLRTKWISLAISLSLTPSGWRLENLSSTGWTLREEIRDWNGKDLSRSLDVGKATKKYKVGLTSRNLTDLFLAPPDVLILAESPHLSLY